MIKSIHGFEDVQFRFDRNNRDNEDMITKLGKFIKTVSESVGSAGVLVFFPCYSVMEQYVENWNDHNIGFNKVVQKEPRENLKLELIMKSHKELCNP